MSYSFLLIALVLPAIANAGSGVKRPVSSVRAAEAELDKWTHRDADNWSKKFKGCSGLSQSPINLENTESEMFGNDYLPLKFTNYGVIPTNQTVTNNGHSITVNFESKATPQISDGGLPANHTYKLAQYDIHWGSEHTIDSVRYDMEIQLVHYNSKYSYGDSFHHADGIAVLSILFQSGSIDNAALFPLIQTLKKKQIEKEGSSVEKSKFHAFSSLLPINFNMFYRYNGSLTEPPCNEVVNWTVFPQVQKISRTQLAVLRNAIKDVDGAVVEDNTRPIQPTNGRKVYRTFE